MRTGCPETLLGGAYKNLVWGALKLLRGAGALKLLRGASEYHCIVRPLMNP